METPEHNSEIITFVVLDSICMSRNTCLEILNSAGELPWGTPDPRDARAWKHAKELLVLLTEPEEYLQTLPYPSKALSTEAAQAGTEDKQQKLWPHSTAKQRTFLRQEGWPLFLFTDKLISRGSSILLLKNQPLEEKGPRAAWCKERKGFSSWMH